MSGDVNQVLWAMTAMASLGVAVFFLRFWRQTADRLFLLFAAAFGLLAAHWTVLAALNPVRDSRHLAYLIRLAAFLVIIIAILDKNRKPR